MLCPRCGRGLSPWPIPGRTICSPKDWANCIRNDITTNEENDTWH